MTVSPPMPFVGGLLWGRGDPTFLDGPLDEGRRGLAVFGSRRPLGVPSAGRTPSDRGSTGREPHAIGAAGH